MNNTKNDSLICKWFNGIFPNYNNQVVPFRLYGWCNVCHVRSKRWMRTSTLSPNHNDLNCTNLLSQNIQRQHYYGENWKEVEEYKGGLHCLGIKPLTEINPRRNARHLLLGVLCQM